AGIQIMARLLKALIILSVCAWCFVLFTPPVLAQQPVELNGGAVRISDLGLEREVLSAIDLVGPQDGSAGRNRSALTHRLKCWIDGIASCSFADKNDPRVRAIRRFLGLGPPDQDGSVIVHFPDQTRIEVRLMRVADPDVIDWKQSVYQPVVLTGTAEAPGLAAVPSRPDHFVGFAYDGAPAIEAALERLKYRFEEASDSESANFVDDPPASGQRYSEIP
ncbi:MAG: hypothetical protein ACPGJE_06105, partial [Wenzhouxiangellaceae bacterium]